MVSTKSWLIGITNFPPPILTSKKMTYKLIILHRKINKMFYELNHGHNLLEDIFKIDDEKSVQCKSTFKSQKSQVLTAIEEMEWWRSWIFNVNRIIALYGKLINYI